MSICFDADKDKENKEKNLIRKTLSGDEYAFKELTEPYMPMLYNYIKIKVARNEDAEDILQETMLGVWKSLDKYSTQSSFKTWAFSIAKHKIADFYGDRQRKNAMDTDLPEDIPQNDIFADIDDKLDLYAALSKMPEEYRELIYMIFNAGLSYEEIQNLTGMKIGTVKSKIYYIKKTLYKMLVPEGGDADERD